MAANQLSDMPFCPFFHQELVRPTKEIKENFRKNFMTKNLEKRTKLSDSQEDDKEDKEEEEKKVIEAEKNKDDENEDTGNKTIPWTQAPEIIDALLKEEKMVAERRKNKQAFLEKEAQRQYGEDSEMKEVDLKNSKNFMLSSIEKFVEWLRKEPDKSTYEKIEEEIQRLINGMRMIDFMLNKRRTEYVDQHTNHLVL